MTWHVEFVDLAKNAPGLSITVRALAWSDRGNCDEAALTVQGDGQALRTLNGWIGREVRIYNPQHTMVWFGIVAEVNWALTNKWAIGRTLSRLANRVRIAYTKADAFGASTSLTTSWAEDATSQATYGIREVELSIGEASDDEATAARTQALLRADPRPTRRRARVQGAEVVCWGFYHFLNWQYYENLAGRIEHDGDDEQEISIGWGLSGATNIGWYDRYLHDVGGRLSALRDGDRVWVAKSGANSGEKTIASVTGDGQISYTATTIHFEENDDIKDTASGFREFYANGFVNVSGSGSNSGYHYVDGKSTDGHMTTAQSFTGAIVNEGTGPSITLLEGEYADVGTVTEEEPGTSTALTLYGYEVAQEFIPSTTMALERVAVRVAKIGSPADNLLVELCADSAGAPGTVLGTATLAAVDAAADSVTDTWIEFASLVSVTASTSYWLKVRRSSSLSATAHWLLGLVEETSETTLFYLGSSWTAATRDGVSLSMPYRLWDSEDTSDAMERIVTDCGGSFVTAVTVSATSVYRNQYVAEKRRGGEELERLLDIGTASGDRLTAMVNSKRTLTIAAQVEQPTSVAGLPVLGDDDRIYEAQGAAWQPGMSPVGNWLALRLPMGIASDWEMALVYVQAARYDVQAAAWEIKPGDAEEMLGIYSRE